MNLIKFINELGYPKELINKILNNKDKYIYSLHIKGKLQIAPRWELKIIQKILKDYLIQEYLSSSISNNSTAYLKGKNISYNLNRHQGNSYFFVSDFKNFFPSFEKNFIKNTLLNILNNEDKEHIKLIISLILYNNKLQYGFPTSPIISNILMKNFDNKLNNNLLKDFPNNNIQYTRYADDITISSKYRIDKNKLKNSLNNLIDEDFNFLTINEKKTRSFEKYAKTPYITGLVPLNKRNTIGKKKYNQLKINLYLLMKNQLIKNPNFYKSKDSARSYISYLYLVDKHNYNRLKYYFLNKFEKNEVEIFFKK